MTKCPICGRESPDSATECVGCSAPLTANRVNSAAPKASVGDDETRLAPTHVPLSAGGGAGIGPLGGLIPGQTFGHRYQVINLLGTGGMGAVYHVWDAELGMSVALKVIRPDTDPASAHDLERRFKRELVLARQVTHPNVIRIHDLGEVEGIKFITMPFVQGTDLARILAKEGRLSVPRALVIARQIASGLRAAHEVGVVHRDLKPANILLDTNDHTQITDFGIARSTDTGTIAAAAGGTLSTGAGAVIGTLAYMAPEQASGKPVDQRADVYAFGLIFYEMLTGKPAASGSGESALAMLIERSRQAPPGLRTVDPTLPEPLERIVTRCLAPDSQARYQSAVELEAALEELDATGHKKVPVVPRRQVWPVLVAGVLVAIAAGVSVWSWTRSSPSAPPAPAPNPISVLVADFDNQTKDPVFEESLEQGLTLAIEGASFITSFPRVTAVNALAQINPGAPLDEAGARIVAAREDIKLVLTGSIAAEGGGYRLMVRAIDSRDGKELATAEERVADKQGVLGALGRAASSLRSRLGDATPESAHMPGVETVTASSIEALRSYAVAQDLAASGRSEESIPHYAQAIAVDPEFGRAYSGWATSLYNTGRRDEAEKKWQEATARMHRMTERESLRTLGGYFLGPGASYQRAIEQFQILVEKYPADRAGHINLGIAYFQTLQFQKALEEARTTAEIFPKSSRARSNYGLIAMYASEFELGQREAAKAIPDQYKAYLPIAAAAFVNSDLEEARKSYEQMRERGTAGASLADHGLADLTAYEGRWSAAVTALKAGIVANEAAKNTSARALKLIVLAEILLSRGEHLQAAATARQAVGLIREDATLVPAALVFLRAGRPAEASQIAADLAGRAQSRSRAYAEIIEAEIARAGRRLNDARDRLERARKFADVWLGRYFSGIVEVEAARFQDAAGELQICVSRRGEAMALFFDDVPTFRYLAPLNYWIGRAQEGLGTKTAADHYQKFLALRPESPNDPLVVDARKRLTMPGQAGSN